LGGKSVATYEVGDIVSTEFGEEYDLISLNFDSLNHIRRGQDWTEIFRRVHHSLRRGGAFVFDINLPDRLRNDWNVPEIIAKPDALYVQLSYPVKSAGAGIRRTTPMLVLRRTEDGETAIAIAMIEQFALPLSDAYVRLRRAGFDAPELLSSIGSVARGHIFNKNRAFICARRSG